MTSKGFVKIWRSILDEQDLVQNKNYMFLFIYCILRAHWEDRKMVFDNKYQVIPRGSFITGYRDLQNELKLKSIGVVQRGLQHLAQTKRIEYKSDTKGTRITVCNYERFQGTETDAIHLRNDSDTPVDTPMDTRVDTPMGTTNKRKKKEEGKKEETSALQAPLEPNAGSLSDKKGPEVQTELELKPTPADEPQDPKKKAAEELRLWRVGLDTWVKAEFILLGLEPATYPKLDNATMGLLSQRIKSFGDVLIGVKQVYRAMKLNNNIYEETANAWNFPTIQNVLSNAKWAPTVAKADKDGFPFMDIPNDPAAFYREAKAYLDQAMMPDDE